jgi:uncharacterized protein YccT (UPF0319 family)
MDSENLIIKLNSNNIENILDKPILIKIEDAIKINFLSKHTLNKVQLTEISRLDTDFLSKKTIKASIDVTLSTSSNVNFLSFDLKKTDSNVNSFIKFFTGRKGTRFLQVYLNFIYLDENGKFLTKKTGKATTSNEDDEDGKKEISFN